MPLQSKSLWQRQSVGVLLTTDGVSGVATINAAPPGIGGIRRQAPSVRGAEER
jgi:hypothetical protein